MRLDFLEHLAAEVHFERLVALVGAAERDRVVRQVLSDGAIVELEPDGNRVVVLRHPAPVDRAHDRDDVEALSPGILKEKLN